MGYEIDFLPVGDEGQSGDAILIRFGDLNGTRTEQTVVLVDGGFQTTADAIQEHLEQYYKTDTIDLVVSTHPDCDHINGLKEIVDRAVQGQLTIGELWMHRPSLHRAKIERAVEKAAGSGYVRALKATLDTAAELEKESLRAGIPIQEPFAGLVHSSKRLFVAGPTLEFFESIFEEEASAATAESRLMKWIAARREAVRKVLEDWGIETLDDSGVTSPVNNSSAVLVLAFENGHALLTADAGKPALERVADLLDHYKFLPERLRFIQVPHHGSQRNVGPTVLDRLLGPRLTGDTQVRSAFVSASRKGAPKHPAKKVTNAFRRRGTPVHATQGLSKRHHHDAPGRDWTASEPLPFYHEVDE